MKRFLPFAIVAIMAGLTSWGMSQGIRCFPGRFAWFPSGNRVPMPLTQQRPLVPAFQYPPGVAPTMSNMPLPTRNPMFDVDISSQSFDMPSPPFLTPTLAPIPTLAPAPNLFVLTPPAQSTPWRFQPIPVFSIAAQGVVAGRFDSMSRKHNTPFVTPWIIIEEVPEEPMVTTPTQASTSPPLQIVGPLPQSEPLDNIAVESDPFVADDVPVVVTPDATEDDADDFDPFNSPFDDDADDAPVVVTPDATEDEAEESDPFESPFDDDADDDADDSPVVVVTPEAMEDEAEDADPFESPFDDEADDAPVVVVTPEASEVEADDSDPFDSPFDDDAPVVAPTLEVDEDDLDSFDDEF